MCHAPYHVCLVWSAISRRKVMFCLYIPRLGLCSCIATGIENNNMITEVSTYFLLLRELDVLYHGYIAMVLHYFSFSLVFLALRNPSSAIFHELVNVSLPLQLKSAKSNRSFGRSIPFLIRKNLLAVKTPLFLHPGDPTP
jgi:hypothetical protein